jgi:hypothetical protein
MLFEKINLEKLTIEELTILFQSLSDYNFDNEKNKDRDQIDTFLDRISSEIQGKEIQIALQVNQMFRGNK